MRRFQLLKGILIIVSLVFRLRRCLNRSDDLTARFIPESELGYFCPNVDVCGSRHSTSDLSTDHLQAEFTYCCKECSCEPGCVEKQNCCYPKLNTFSQIDRSDQECFFPVTERIFLTSYMQYFMTYKIKSGSKYLNDTFCLPVDSDGNFNLRELFPVYSPTAKRIYVNQKCALLNEVTDGIPWDAYSVCNSFSALETSAQYMSELVENPSMCTLHFEGPVAEYADIDNEQCYFDLVSTCNGEDFEVPAGSNMSKQDVVDWCQNGLFSPYIKHKNYVNVFCYICNGKTLYREVQCVERKSFKERRGPIDFLVMLNFDYLLSRKNKNGKAVVHVCRNFSGPGINENEKTCRKLFCPPGYIRQTDGRCVSVISTWIVDRLDIKLKLTPAQTVQVSDVKDFNKARIRSPWPRNWKLMSLMYTKSERNDEIVDYIVVHLVNVKPNINYPSSITHIKAFLSEVWTLNVKYKDIFLNPKIYEYKLFDKVTVNSDIEVPYWSTKLNLSFPALHGLYSQPKYRIKGAPYVYLIKLHFCEQIQLEVSDYTLLAIDRVLFFSIESRFFCHGEFTLVTDQHGAIHPRICVDDTAFGKYNAGTQTPQNSMSWKVLALQNMFLYLWASTCISMLVV